MNYGQLKAAIASWMKRTNLTGDIPTLVELTEARLARRVRVAQQITSGTASVAVSGLTASLPTDFLEAKAIGFASFDSPLDVASLEKVLDARRQYVLSGNLGARPWVYSIQGQTMHLGPAADAAYTFTVLYYARWPALVKDADTNWLLTNHPGVYLWAALAEACVFSVEDDRMGLFETKFAADLAELKASDDAAQYSGASLQISTIGTQAVV